MAVTQSDAVRNAKLDAAEAAIGASPILRWLEGTMPANESAALSGNDVVAQGVLPSDWLTAASGGVKQKNGTWTLTGQAAAGAGTLATFYRIYAADGTTCHEQGTLTVTGGGGDMTADNVNVANGQSINVGTYQKTAAH